MASTRVGKLTIQTHTRMKVKDVTFLSHRWVLFHMFSTDNFQSSNDIIFAPYNYQGTLFRTKEFSLSLL